MKLETHVQQHNTLTRTTKRRVLRNHDWVTVVCVCFYPNQINVYIIGKTYWNAIRSSKKETKRKYHGNSRVLSRWFSSMVGINPFDATIVMSHLRDFTYNSNISHQSRTKVSCWPCRNLGFPYLMAFQTKFFWVQSSNLQVSNMGPTRLIGQSFSHVQRKEKEKKTPVQCTGMTASPLSEC